MHPVNEAETRALILAIHLLQKDPVHAGKHELAHEELLVEGAELAAGLITSEARGALADLHIRKPHSRQSEARNLLGSLHDGDFLGQFARILHR